MSARPIQQRFTDVQSLIDKMSTSHNADAAGPEIAQLKSEQSADEAAMSASQEQQGQLQAKRQQDVDGEKAIDQTVSQLEEQIKKLQGGLFGGWRHRHQIDAVKTKISGEQADKQKLADDVTALDGKIATTKQDIADDQSNIQAGPMLMTRLRMAVEEFATDAKRQMGSRADEWTAKLNAAEKSVQTALTALQKNPTDAKADQACRAAMKQLAATLSQLQQENTSDQGVVQKFQGAISNFKPFVDQDFEKRGMDGADQQLAELGQETQSQSSAYTSGDNALRGFIKDELNVVDADYHQADVSLGQRTTALQNLDGVDKSLDSLEQLVKNYTAAARSRGDLSKQAQDLNNQLSDVESQFESAQSNLPKAQAYRDQLLPQYNDLRRRAHHMHEEGQRIELAAQQVMGQLQGAQRQLQGVQQHVAAAKQQMSQAQAAAQQAQAALPAAKQAVVNASKPHAGFKSYTVQPGDTPGGIAAKFGVSDWHAIMQANQGTYPSWTSDRNMQAGWTLKIPVQVPADPQAVAQAKQAVQKLQGTIQQSQATEAKAKTAIAAATQRSQALQGQVQQLRGQLQQMHQQREEMRQHAMPLMHHLQEVEQEYNQRDAQVQDIKNTMSQLDSQRLDLQNQVKQAQGQLDSCNQAISQGHAEAQTAVQSLNDAVASYNHSVAALDTSLELAAVPGYAHAFDEHGVSSAFMKTFDGVADNPNSADISWLVGLPTAVRKVADARQSSLESSVSQLQSSMKAKEDARYQEVQS